MADKKMSSKIVCLGGGVGTANLLLGIKEYFKNITVVVSMADDGGSAGRLRRHFKIPPTGDIVNCMISLSETKDKKLKELLRYRFPGDRYAADNIIPGQKIANLMLTSLILTTKNLDESIGTMKKIFDVRGQIYPSTLTKIALRAKTSTGHIVRREENIDKGKFKGEITSLYIYPANPKVSDKVVKSIERADVIIAGPGDLYTTVMPVLMIPKISDAIKKSKAKKIFVVNVANKKFETPDYSLEDFIKAIQKHVGFQPFDTFLVNKRVNFKVPDEYKNEYSIAPVPTKKYEKLCVYEDLVDEKFPLYHDPGKLAKAIVKNI